MTAEHGMGKPGVRTALGLVTALGAAVGVVGVVGFSGAGTAAAQPVSLSLKYTCDVPIIDDQHITGRIDANIPSSVAIGRPGKKIDIGAGTTVDADLTPWLGRIGVKTVEGTVEAKIKVAAPQGDRQVEVPLDITRTSIPASGAFDITATGSALTPAFTRPGTARITVGDIVLNVVGKKENGEALEELRVPCTLDAGQSNSVGSFEITGPGAGSTPSGGADPTPSDGSDTNGNGTTSPSTTPTASSTAGGSSTTGGTAGGTTTGSMAATGQDAGNLILPAAGTLVAGVAAFFVGSRLRNRRRAADG
ncbi:hypothetical protein KQY30_02535 [Streptomyces sp. GMY02]|uniref:DUF6801 domain-containing protein n=1 Tax=Streptomyces sp. GMY02 TaxID=1333528 RepID=UPI001C2BDA76|nr:DUF6801 domain-containing protein [Streptomyces sp. GMY02]QXE33339.1 hypothetical protein KQY30_02535 [Streptomyces sp. GMY02]